MTLTELTDLFPNVAIDLADTPAPTAPRPMYRPSDSFEQKVLMAERRLQDEICEEHRLMAIATRGMSQGRFPQSGAIAHEMYLQRKGR